MSRMRSQTGPSSLLTASLLSHIVMRCSAFSSLSALPRTPILSASDAAHRPSFASTPLLHTSKLRTRPGSATTRILCQQAPSVGQDLKEMFDVYIAPPEPIAAFSGEPTPAGFSKQRTKVHRDGDWHRAVHIWLYTSQGDLILQQRSEGKDTFPGKWDTSCAGHVTAGDSVMETARKEVREELGVVIEDKELELLGTIATSIQGSSPAQGAFTCNEYKDVFLVRYDGAVSELNFGEDEVQAVRLTPWADVRDALERQVGEGGEQLDGAFIPRPRHYLDLLFPALSAKFS